LEVGSWERVGLHSQETSQVSWMAGNWNLSSFRGSSRFALPPLISRILGGRGKTAATCVRWGIPPENPVRPLRLS